MLFLDAELLLIPSALLAAGSGLLTAVFLYLYAYCVTKRGQIIMITLFLAAKPVFSILAVFLSDRADKAWYLAAAGVIILSVAACGLFLSKCDLSEKQGVPEKGKLPFWVLFSVFALYTLIVFERMNGAFSLSVNPDNPTWHYLMYFFGCFIAAAGSWWLFLKKNLSVLYAYVVFLAAAILHFVLSIAVENGMLLFRGVDMVFFGISDIIYVFLFVTAAVLSASRPGKGVFIGFTFVFGLAIFIGFALSGLFYVLFEAYYSIIYALVSLVIIAMSILLAPVLATIGDRPGVRRKTRPITGPGSDTPKPGAMHETDPSHPDGSLTAREREIAHLLVTGSTTRKIADTLHIAPSTVKVHSRNIYEKLKIHSRIELIYLYGGGAYAPAETETDEESTLPR